MHTSTHRPPTGSPWDGVPGGVLVDSKVRALGPHVAVRDSPYPVAHPACLAGVDRRHRKRHRRDQDPSRPRRVLQMERDLGLRAFEQRTVSRARNRT